MKKSYKIILALVLTSSFSCYAKDYKRDCYNARTHGYDCSLNFASSYGVGIHFAAPSTLPYQHIFYWVKDKNGNIIKPKTEITSNSDVQIQWDKVNNNVTRKDAGILPVDEYTVTLSGIRVKTTTAGVYFDKSYNIKLKFEPDNIYADHYQGQISGGINFEEFQLYGQLKYSIALPGNLLAKTSVSYIPNDELKMANSSDLLCNIFSKTYHSICYDTKDGLSLPWDPVISNYTKVDITLDKVENSYLPLSKTTMSQGPEQTYYFNDHF